MNRQTIRFLFVTAFVIALAAAAGVIYSAQLAVPAPYTIQTIEKSFEHPSGVLRDSRVLTFALKSDGSTVKVFERRDLQGQLVQQRVIVDQGRSERVVVEPITRSVTTVPLRPQQAGQERAKFAECAVGLNLTRSSILGVDVVMQVRESETPCRAGDDCRLTVRSESWRAPSLSCAELKRITSIKKAGENFVVVTSIEPQAVVRGEPDAKLFQVPSDFIERRPSEVTQELRRMKGDISREADVDAVLDRANPIIKDKVER